MCELKKRPIGELKDRAKERKDKGGEGCNEMGSLTKGPGLIT